MSANSIKTYVEILRQYGLGYGVPIILLLLGGVGWLMGRSWVVCLVLVGAALVWALAHWLRSRPRATPAGKLGFYVARIEHDPGNRRHRDILGKLHAAFDAHPELRGHVELHDLKRTIRYASPSEQAHAAQRLGLKLSATQVIWMERGQEQDQLYHAVLRPARLDQEESPTPVPPRAIPVPAKAVLARYFLVQAFAALGKHEKAIQHLIPKAEAPQQYAAAIHNLGLMYLDLPTGDREQNLQRAIRAFEEALSVWVKHKFPVDWAMTQNNLGAAYAQLPTGDRGENLRRAIEAFEAALTVYTREKFPVDWAMTQNNLGNAYGNLPTGDRGENLRRAIQAYEAALTVYTREKFPVHWAMTQNNLGNAYVDLPTGDRGENLQRAIQAYQAALTVYTPEGFPHKNADVQRNLARACKMLEEVP